jgi:4-hydroxyphenylacetate 3-monooxygenase
MGIRTGKQFLEGIRDDREIWCDGERIVDVTTDPRFAGGARTVAELLDLQNDPALVDRLTYVSPSSGDRVALSTIQPRSQDDLVRRRTMVKTWHDTTCGMFGRSHDSLNVMVSAYAAAADTFDERGNDFGKNILSYYERVRENDVVTTHALISPQVDRSKSIEHQAKDIAARIVGDNDQGFFISGVRMLATLAAFADEILVMPAPSFPLSDAEEAKAHAFGFAIPISTPGLKLIARPSVTHREAGSPMDFPLANRFDDSDCMVLFDKVLIPWERAFIYRDVDTYNSAVRKAHVLRHSAHQFATKDLAKAEFMRDLAITLAKSTNVDRFMHIQYALGELINTVSFVRSSLLASEIEAQRGPSDTVVPSMEPLQAVRFLFPSMFHRACEIIQTIGAGGLMMVPSYAMLDSPIACDIERYFQAANADSRTRIKLFRLACDASLTSFAGRQQLYERYFAGDPVRGLAGYYDQFDAAPSVARISKLLDRWESQIRD